MPRLTAAFLIITLASIGMPALNGFVGEFLTMLGAFLWDPRFVVAAGLGVILSAVYMLWMFQRVYLGADHAREERHAARSAPREWASVVPLCALAIVMGVFPTLFLRADGAGGEARSSSGCRSRSLRVRERRRSASAHRQRRQTAPAGNGVEPVGWSSRCSNLSTRRRRADAVRHAGRAGRDGRPKRSAARASACRWAGSASSGWPARRCPRCCCGTRRRSFREDFGVIVADNFGLFVTLVLVAGRHPDDHVLVAGDSPRQPAGGRVLRAGAVLDRRDDDDGDGHRSAGDLHRARDPVARGLRADRHPPRQIRRAPRRRSSTSCSARSRARSSSTASPSPTASPAARGCRRSARTCRRSR